MQPTITTHFDQQVLDSFASATFKAVDAILPLHANLTMGYKQSSIHLDGREIVTEADTLSDHILSEHLSNGFRHIFRVTEEQAKSHQIGTDTFFTIDGLDGTICFAGRYPGAETVWGILLGYIEAGEPQLASIYLRDTNQLISVNRRLGEIKIDGSLLAPITYPETLTVAMDLGSWQSPNVEKSIVPALRDAGIACITDRPSAAGIADYLIRGKAHAWVTRVARIWDVTPIAAAMYAIGGVVEPLYQEKMDWTVPYPDPAIYACSPEAARRVKEVLLNIPKDRQF